MYFRSSGNYNAIQLFYLIKIFSCMQISCGAECEWHVELRYNYCVLWIIWMLPKAAAGEDK